jgi:trehalose 6-phosphate synthase
MALSMPAAERRMRYEAMMDRLKRHSIQDWFADFIRSLQDSQSDGEAQAGSALWQRRVTHAIARH